jgi:hypothetical protein
MAKDALQDDDDEEDDDGKFLELGNEITKAFGPLGIITAGYDEEHLDLIIDACESAISQVYNARVKVALQKDSTRVPALQLQAPQHLPVAVLGKSDLHVTFGRLLMELEERDCVLPADGDELLLLNNNDDNDNNAASSSSLLSTLFSKSSSKRRNFNYLKYPLILFSGFEIPALQVSELSDVD